MSGSSNWQALGQEWLLVRGAFGAVQGSDCNVSGVRRFLGIPYATPPVGALRWRPPRPLQPWHGFLVADRPAARCIQHAPYGELEAGNPLMSEDCLYLNIWTPRDPGGLPVIFWIHGGEFFAGSGTEPRYDSARLASRGVVVVTVNHRLGVFGFLSHPELTTESSSGTSGNYGLLDLIAALEWVRDNIEVFGGNPGNVTISGESAGSCAVGALMASPLARGLFHRAVGQSGAYFMPEPHAMKPLLHAENEQRGLEFQRSAGATSIAELRAMSGTALLEVWLKDKSKRMHPCIDGFVVPRPVDVIFNEGEQARVPLLAGWNKDEAGYMRAHKDKFDFAAFQSGLHAYFGSHAEPLWRAYGDNTAEPFVVAMTLTGHRNMAYPTWKWIEAHARCAPTFAYRFDRWPPGSVAGPSHACEIEYVFGTLSTRALPRTEDDRSLSDAMGNYWVNFARSGDPNGSGLPPWIPYSNDCAVMQFDTKMGTQPLREAELLRALDRAHARMTF